MGGSVALDLGHAWGDANDVGCDGRTWRYRRKDSVGATRTATLLGKLHNDNRAFLPVRRAS